MKVRRATGQRHTPAEARPAGRLAAGAPVAPGALASLARRTATTAVKRERAFGPPVLPAGVRRPVLARRLANTDADLRAAGTHKSPPYALLLKQLTEYAAADVNDVTRQLRLLREMKSPISRLMSSLDVTPELSTFLLSLNAAVERELLAARDVDAPKAGKESPFERSGEHSFEWWFNYIFGTVHKLGTAGALTAAAVQWATAYHQYRTRDVKPAVAPPNGFGFTYTFDAADKLAVLTALFNEGFVPVGEADAGRVVPMGEAHSATEESAGYQKVLPNLQETGLVYRSDSRAPDMIKKHGGSVTRSRQGGEEMARKMNMLADWNPMKDPVKRKQMLLRLGHEDNDLNTVVSLAVDPRDAVKFPLIAGTGAGDVPKSDTRNLYVIYVPTSTKVLDTSHVISQEKTARHQPAVATFGRGELGSPAVGFEQHLLHIQTERFWSDADPYAYVVGKVKKVTKMNVAQWSRLPPKTKEGLEKLLTELGVGGSLEWLVHGTPTAGIAGHQQLEQQAYGARALITSHASGGKFNFPLQTITVDAGADAEEVEILASKGTVDAPTRAGNQWRATWKGMQEQQPITLRATVTYPGGRKIEAPVRTVQYIATPGSARFQGLVGTEIRHAAGTDKPLSVLAVHPDIDGFQLDTEGNGTIEAAGVVGRTFKFVWKNPVAAEKAVTMTAVPTCRGERVEALAITKGFNIT